MSASTQHLTRMTRPVKKLEKPRPLKIPNQNRHSVIDARLGALEEIMTLAETVAVNLANANYDKSLQTNVMTLNGMLKGYGGKLEAVYKDQLDRAFVTFRNGSRDEQLDYVSRLHLLELIELRAKQWDSSESNLYYKHKVNYQDVDIISVSSVESSLNSPNVFQNSPMSNPLTPQTSTQPLLLGPGELVKSSGKFVAPTKIPGKSYCKDEVVIRNSDSGKVMGIKGRRVHMIEELSETVISFQRVNPGAKERLVQITGPSEEKINYAKQLMEDTIKRNASPVRSELPDKDRLGSSSSLNSSTSDDSLRYRNPSLNRPGLLHSFSTNDANLGEYKHTVTVGENSLKITGTNPDLVRIAKLVLDEYFTPVSEQLNEFGFDEENESFEPVRDSGIESILRVNSQDSEESEETFKVQQTKEPTGIMKSMSFTSTLVPSHSSSPHSRFDSGFNESDENTPFFTDAPGLTPEEAMTLNAISDSAKQKKKGITRTSDQSSTPSGAQKPIIMYSCDEILSLADSPLSHKTPTDWNNVIKDFPVIVKKLPVEWFESQVYAKKRLQESDAIVAIQSLSETGSPETE